MNANQNENKRGINLPPILWSYFTDKETRQPARFYQVSVNYSIVEIKDGNNWIDKKEWLKKYRPIVKETNKLVTLHTEFVW